MLHLSQRSPAAVHHACVCRGKKEESEWKAQSGQVPVGGFIWLFHGPDCLQLSRSTSSSSGRNLFLNASVTPNIYQLWNWLLWPYGWYICWPSLFNICSANKELLAGLKAKGSGLAVVCWKMMCAHPRRKHHFRNFQFLHHPPPSELSF